MNHPALLTLLVLATVVSLVQLAQLGNDLTIRLSTGLSGVALFPVVPIVAVVGLIASVRRSARNWSIGMAAVLAIWIGLFATADLGAGAGPHAVVGFYTEGPSQPGVAVFVVDLAVRLLVGAAGVFWYALRGPRWQPRALPAWGRHPGLLTPAVGAAVLSLVGVLVLSATAVDGNHAIFTLFDSARLGEPYGAVVGIGNVWRAEGDALDTAAATWNLGWLLLVATATAGAVSALLRRRGRWAAGILVPLVGSLTIGLAATGTHLDRAGVRILALLLAAMTVTAASGVVWYAWRGAR